MPKQSDPGPNLEMLTWAESLPFLEMDEATSIELLADYIVFKDNGSTRNQAQLAKMLTVGVRRARLDPDQEPMIQLAISSGVRWASLLDHEWLEQNSPHHG